MKARIAPLALLLGIYFGLGLITLSVWNARDVYLATGDEPHYLVISDAILRDATPDVSRAYQREFDTPQFYPSGLSGPSGELVPPYAHVVSATRGTFSWHGLGVPLMIAVPVAVLGPVGAKLVLLAAGSGAVILTWVLSGAMTVSRSVRFLSTAALALAYPLVLAPSQIYPDIPAGVLLLGIVAWWLIPGWRSSPGKTAMVATMAVALPWLGSRFIVAAAVAYLALLASGIRDRRLRGALVVPGILVGAPLLAYNFWAFGSLVGPPTDGALAFTSGVLLVLPGLLFDQNQGLLMANPVLWLSLPGLVLLWRRRRAGVLVWLGLFTAIWVPAAAHPGLYGLGSFNGRYAWPLALLAIAPALASLASVARRSRLLFGVIVAAGIAFQSYLVALGLFVGGARPGSPVGLDLYTRPPETWLEAYSAWWFPLQQFLPAWYSTEWAFRFAPNWVWLAVALVLVFCAVTRIYFAWWVFVTLATAIVVTGLISAPGDRFVSKELDVTLSPLVDQPGYPVIGPSHEMRSGHYTWSITYSSPGNAVIGKWELVRALDDTVVAAGEITGTGGVVTSAGATIPFQSWQPREFVWRIGWYGSDDMRITQTSVRFGESTPE